VKQWQDSFHLPRCVVWSHTEGKELPSQTPVARMRTLELFFEIVKGVNYFFDNFLRIIKKPPLGRLVA